MLAFVVLMAAHGRFRGAHCAVLGAHGRVLGARGRVRRAPIARAAPPFGMFGDLQFFFAFISAVTPFQPFQILS